MRSLQALAILLALLLSGCSSLVKGLVYPLTEHSKCIERCTEQYRSSKDAYMEALCRDRCNRELGSEESRPN